MSVSLADPGDARALGSAAKAWMQQDAAMRVTTLLVTPSACSGMLRTTSMSSWSYSRSVRSTATKHPAACSASEPFSAVELRVSHGAG